MKKQGKRKSYGGRALSGLLVLCLLFGMLPTAALAAEEESQDGGTPSVVCAELEGCTGGTHDESCPLYAEEESAGKDALIPAEPTATEQVAALIAALPEYADAMPDDIAAIEVAQTAYDALTVEEQAAVDPELVSKLADLVELAQEMGLILSENNAVSTYAVNTITTDTTWSGAVTLNDDLTVKENVTLTLGAQVTISGNVTIKGGGFIKRATGYTGTLFDVPSGASLTVENLTIDGGAVYGDADSSKEQQVTVGYNCQSDDAVSGIKSTGSLIRVDGGSLTLENGAVLQNNFLLSTAQTYPGASGSAGALGAGVGIINGGNFQMDGGTITRQVAGGGSAVYCGGGSTFVLNGGEITKNFSGYNSSGGGAAVHVVSSTFTMNGGKISYNACHNNTAVAVQGADPQFTMYGGEICYNYGAGGNYGTIMATNGTAGTLKVDLLGGHIHHNRGHIGGAIVTYGAAAVTIAGDCEIDNNTGKIDYACANIISVENTGTLTAFCPSQRPLVPCPSGHPAQTQRPPNQRPDLGSITTV